MPPQLVIADDDVARKASLPPFFGRITRFHEFGGIGAAIPAFLREPSNGSTHSLR